MARPKRRRFMSTPPKVEGFRPFGTPMSQIDPVVLLYEEYEAINLADYQNLTHEEASVKMEVSRPTFTRIYNEARKTVAAAFVEGRAIIIKGGDFHSEDFWYRCQACDRTSTSKKELNHCPHCGSDDIIWLNESSTPLYRRRGERRGEGRGEGRGRGRGRMADSEGVCICFRCKKEVPHIKGTPCNKRLCPECGTHMMRKGSYHHMLYQKSQGEE